VLAAGIERLAVTEGHMRTVLYRATAVALALTAAGCGMFRKSGNATTSIDPNTAQGRFDWKASLFTPSELAGATQVRGTAAWMRDGTAASTVTISLSNATAGGVHPWHIHAGHCGENGAIVGSTAAYTPLAVNDKGNASSNAHLAMSLPSSGDYYVNVHASVTNLGTIISCGNLAAPVS
jgi:hypothetical protein